jgi:hypothetical protein
VSVDPAVLRARRVVGLYGDPDATWSVVLALRLESRETVEALMARSRALVEEHPHLGTAPDVDSYSRGEEAALLDTFANLPYSDTGPLLRVGLSEDGLDLVIAAHHGVVDGLGLLGVASSLLDRPVTSTARGIARESEPSGFVRRSVHRLIEALLDPPGRVRGDRGGSRRDDGDWLECRPVDARGLGSPALVAAVVDLTRKVGTTRRRGLVVAMGLSRRPGTPVPEPDRDTAYVRLHSDHVRSVQEARRLIAATSPEPAFPVTDGAGAWPRLVRLLSGRLGATLLVSNLGLVEGSGVTEARFWPVPSGPAGVCLGLASTATGATLTVRARRAWFSQAAVERLASVAVDCLTRAADEPQ